MDQASTSVSNRGRARRRKRTLLCITGGRPQGITQAIYALSQMVQPWLPDEIVVVTTRRGRDAIVRCLFDNGVFEDLCRDAGLQGVDFSADKIRLIRGSRGRGMPLDDILTPDHDRAAGDFVLDEVARLTEDPDRELRVSLAGERYLIGFYAGHALSLLGRRQDRLMHVQVDESRHRDEAFFYPGAGGKDKHAEVAITDVPFMRVERLVSMRLLAKHADYATMCTAFEDRAHLQVRNAFRGMVFTFSRAFDIPCDSSHRVQRPRFEPRAAALYAYYAWRAHNSLPFVSDEELLSDPTPLLQMYDICLLGGTTKSFDAKWRKRLSRDSLMSARSRIGRALKTLIKDGAKYQAYRVHTCRDDRSYGLDLGAEQICFRDFALEADSRDTQERQPLWSMRGRN